MSAFSLLILSTLCASLKTEKFNGIIFDPSGLEENSIDFKDGFEEWAHQGVKIINLESDNIQYDNIPSNGSILVPEPDASGASKHILERNFTIGAESKLEMWFSVYVVGYNSTIVHKENVPDLNPSFSISIVDLTSGNESQILDLARCNVTDNEWNYRQFYINVKEQAAITIKFSMARNVETNTIALGDIKIQWVPVLRTEINHQHSDVLFDSESDDDTTTTEATSSSTSVVETSTTSSTPIPIFTSAVFENSTNVDNSSSPGSSTTTSTATSTTPSTTTTTTTSTTTSTTTLTTEASSTDTTTNSSTTASINETTTGFVTENTTAMETTSVTENQTTTLEYETTTTISELSTTDSQTNATNTNSTTPISISSTEKTPSSTANVTIQQTTTPQTITESTVISTGSSQLPIIDRDSEFSGYGYPVEVALICLVVLFGVMFLVMVVKYYRLRTTIGDYRLRDNNGGRQTYDNPAFNGFGLQDTYRSR